jgi:hypothetical protein
MGNFHALTMHQAFAAMLFGNSQCSLHTIENNKTFNIELDVVVHGNKSARREDGNVSQVRK